MTGSRMGTPWIRFHLRLLICVEEATDFTNQDITTGNIESNEPQKITNIGGGLILVQRSHQRQFQNRIDTDGQARGSQRAHLTEAESRPKLVTSENYMPYVPVNGRTILLQRAFYDDRISKPVVRVLAPMSCTERRKLYCRLIFGAGQEAAYTRPSITVAADECSAEYYEAHIITCPVPNFTNKANKVPLGIQVFAGDRKPPNEELAVPMLPVRLADHSLK